MSGRTCESFALRKGLDVTDDAVGPKIEDKLEALRREEFELERLRWLLSAEHWPRIYSVLARVRAEIKEAEKSDSPRRAA